ncbi:multiple epidermal growth factor-like domains protein 10 [Saccostrea cucullata]|uniref:multiple epidermal growth factor-like domains protein 10 n=1 Tax=Saccostrea cuccullata TaxID=36930 RepID=UPI002ED27DEF
MACVKVLCMLTGIIFSRGYDDLSRNKPATQISTFPCKGCADGSYNAELAVDNNLQTCTRNVFPDWTEWWMVDLQEAQSIYAIKFVFKDYGDTYRKRQEERLSGYSIYVSDTKEIKSGELCFKHNGTYLPSLTAVVEGVTTVLFVTFCVHNIVRITNALSLTGHVLDVTMAGMAFRATKEIITYPGQNFLCSSHFAACLVGMYGPDCSLSCSGHCKSKSSCNPINGICSDGCAEGWMDVLCNKSCVSGTFRPNCKNNCSGNCYNDLICNSTTGRCDKGCKPGYQGELCNNTYICVFKSNEEYVILDYLEKPVSNIGENTVNSDNVLLACRHGYFGPNCSRKCNPFCINKCQNVNGHCLSGCISGYEGSTCEKKCSSGWYGHNCSMGCNNCVNQTCNHITGSCQYGCKPGWRGSKCSLVCTVDTYGSDCMFSCSQNCINKEPCDHVTGICENGCSDGYKGGQCNLISLLTSMARKCDDHCFYAIGISILVILNVLTCTLWICERRRKMEVRRQSSSHYITTEAEMKEKTSESHEYQEVNSVSRDFSYQNLTFDT